MIYETTKQIRYTIGNRKGRRYNRADIPEIPSYLPLDFILDKYRKVNFFIEQELPSRYKAYL